MRSSAQFKLKDDTAFTKRRGSRLPEVIDMHGGTVLKDVYTDEVLGLIAELPDGSCWPIQYDWIMAVDSCTHDFPDYGLRRSWCKKCAAIGYFDFRSGKFSV